MIPPLLKMARNQKTENNNRLFQTELVDGYDNSNSGCNGRFLKRNSKSLDVVKILVISIKILMISIVSLLYLLRHRKNAR